MYTLKSIAKRGTMLGAAVAILASVIIPSASVFADALNPLTERSLLLSSSAPGFQNSDGAGNTFADPNSLGEYYAPPGSGPNGQKSGETFTFRVSTDSVADSRAIKGFSLQYCTSAAGVCQSPGNGTGDARTSSRQSQAAAWAAGKSDLNVNYTSPAVGTDFTIKIDLNDDGDYLDANENITSDWVMETTNVEDTAHSGALTGKNNFIRLKYSGATSGTPALDGLLPTFDTKIQITFKATETNFITNPGDKEFFVKINSYDSNSNAHFVNVIPQDTNTHIIDGGVTVANVMTDSIHITTKVLETMSFSVGTRNRDTVELNCADIDAPGAVEAGCESDDGGAPAIHGTCDPIQQIDNNRLQLGNPDAEYSLETGKTWDVYSYWRLSSNSSGGATVYYSGNTLANTVGDEIAEVGATAQASTKGTEQFGLGFIDADTDTMSDDFDALVTSTPLDRKSVV